MAERHITSTGDHMAPLSQLPEFEVADDSPDIRGWSVESADGKTLGEVDDLLVDTDQMRARYLVVDLAEGDPGVAAHKEGRTILVPVDTARLDSDRHRVRAGIGATDLPGYTGSTVESGVDKRPVLKEEVVLTKDVISEEQEGEADVRQERVDVERTGRSAAADKRRRNR